MNSINNLFWFGKKELTQDAVLMWIFRNYSNPDFESIAKDIVGEFALGRKLKKGEKIVQLRGKQQHNDIDVAIEVELKSTTDAGWYSLIIEDKTYSYIHDGQITKYLDNMFKIYDDVWHTDMKPVHLRLIYFKTTAFNDYDETEPSEEAKKATKGNNAIFAVDRDVLKVDLKDFYEKIISRYLNSPNQVLRDYSSYIKDKYDALAEQNKGSSDISKFFLKSQDLWDSEIDERKIELSNIFFGSVFKRFGNQIGHCDFSWNQFGYFWFKHFKNINEDQSLPVLELRSRDFTYENGKTKIIARLVNYTDFLCKLRSKDNERYERLVESWTKYLDKYSSSLILDQFKYETSSKKKDRMQLGTLTYEKAGSISYDELFEVLNKLMDVQELIDDELEAIG